MSVSVDQEDLLAACEWISAGAAAAVDCEVYVSRTTGLILWSGDGVDDELPDDIDDESACVAFPDASEFNRGRSLALRFTDEHLPDSRDAVAAFFRKRGAFERFKSILDRAGQLDAWHRYEEAAIEDDLRTWCAENGFVLVKDSEGLDA